jgi:hypothetical protein
MVIVECPCVMSEKNSEASYEIHGKFCAHANNE